VQNRREVRHKTAAVQSMFNSIAHRYDFLNHFLSFGVDFYWRRKSISLLKPFRPQRILDVATGTGDFAIASLRLKPTEVVGVDISERMIKLGIEKLRKKKLDGLVRLQAGNAEGLQFPGGSFDAVTVAFGVRNFENLKRGLSEMHRVLKPGGAALILEFSSPDKFPFKQAFGFYFRSILPIIGGSISGHTEAYRYLPQSVQAFPDRDGFVDVLLGCGFASVRHQRLTFGIASAYLASK
jgi:demethylmenaquinone methyltransferase/2-methoxy-6-polyprenyl-1,4-benzoquinol methylase